MFKLLLQEADHDALGKRIITILLDRINTPTQANQIIHIASKVIVRSST